MFWSPSYSTGSPEIITDVKIKRELISKQDQIWTNMEAISNPYYEDAEQIFDQLGVNYYKDKHYNRSKLGSGECKTMIIWN